MNCFQIIKSVLDEAYVQIPGDEAEKDEVIKAALDNLREEYLQLLQECNINYSDPTTRFAYIYVYVTSHSNLVCNIIEQTPVLGDLFDKQKVKVACIGGGPGSDFLGILKYLMTKKKSPTIQFHLYDREKSWGESWSDVEDKVEDLDFRISTSYMPLDVTKRDDWESHIKYFQSDLFTMIYFMSEVFSLRDSAEEYFAHLFDQAKTGSFFLFIDNNNSHFYNWFDQLAQNHKIDILRSNETKMKVPIEEEKSDLGKYFDKFSHPKLTANVAYRIGRKS
ncbi:hypothetical protein NDA07_22985 [Microcoleus vaginatus DQ-U2]|uniref:hypothetical protein n=1 Tax=Microcoleus vaginatus TaxID=119532 RepID=UPI0016822EC3|nr:hypothetical protein [Microcoleus sp. FACHB-DQ6]